MKRITATLIALSTLVTLAACSGKKTDQNPTDAPATNSPGVTTKAPVTDEPENTDELTTEAPGDATEEPGADNEGDGNGEGSENATSVPIVAPDEISNAEDVLITIFAAYSEDEKFPVGGGDSEHYVDNLPGAFDLSDAERVNSILCMPASEVGKLTSAASMVHMLNANTFTAAAFASDGDLDALADAFTKNIDNRQWICGFPETLVVMKTDGYLVTAFGSDDLIQVFKNHALAEIEGMTVITEKPVEMGGEGLFGVPEV